MKYYIYAVVSVLAVLAACAVALASWTAVACFAFASVISFAYVVLERLCPARTPEPTAGELREEMRAQQAVTSAEIARLNSMMQLRTQPRMLRE